MTFCSSLLPRTAYCAYFSVAQRIGRRIQKTSRRSRAIGLRDSSKAYNFDLQALRCNASFLLRGKIKLRGVHGARTACPVNFSGRLLPEFQKLDSKGRRRNDAQMLRAGAVEFAGGG